MADEKREEILMLKGRHIELHRKLDELLACYLRHGGSIDHSINQLMKFSYEQTINPTVPHG